MIRRTLVIPHTAPKATGEFLSEAPLQLNSSHISESFPLVSPGNRSTFFKLSFKKKKGEEEEEGEGEGKRPLHILLCPLITRLSLKQMADQRPVYINTCSFERGNRLCICWTTNLKNEKKRSSIHTKTVKKLHCLPFPLISIQSADKLLLSITTAHLLHNLLI